MTLKHTDILTIGQLAARTGVAVSALRYYEERGLIRSLRSGGRHRRFLRSDIRRVSFIRIAQSLGLSIADLAGAFADLPDQRTPTAADWRRISVGIRHELDRKIAELANMRDRLDGCIGCGCLSLKRCALANPADEASEAGAGPRFITAGA
ncbi:MAG TPA: redox-sensitive transcriptional activator SoxR [Hyphomonas sp.]|nr:redox-sensitive transcriptional activator SoxR [Hyphomonas sp.]HRJ01989.1 redox-sensitive transcriptional activator SoxR [Hyphomonas sp.]HRK69122.1 redox-sensitive transcriptional activator SoxR [Hyphomonas sp.]